jgi:hypothetical protein
MAGTSPCHAAAMDYVCGSAFAAHLGAHTPPSMYQHKEIKNEFNANH